MRKLLLLLALSACGSKTSPTCACTTCPCPPLPAAPASLTATASDGQVSLSWQAVSGASHYSVLRSTTAGSGYQVVGSPTGASFADTTVTDPVTYFYVTQAVNAAGAGASSNKANATPYFLNHWRERRYAPELFSGAFGNGVYVALGLEGCAAAAGRPGA